VTPASTVWGLGCLVLFLLPFAAVGVVTGGLALQRAAAGNWQEALFFGVFFLTFGGVGFGGIAAAIAGSRKLKEQTVQEKKYPAEPWLWRQDWASGRIDDQTRGTVLSGWIFALFWNLVSIPGAYFGVRAALKENNHAALVALLFPLVGIGLLVWAARATIRYRKYGASRLQLSTIPAAVGRTLAGIVSVPNVLRPPEGFLATLSCIRRQTTGGGKNRSTSEDILWQDERRVHGAANRAPTGMVTKVPIAFRIPPDASVTDSSNPRSLVGWRLRLSAEVPGVDYDSVFEVPVFRTAASEQPLSAEEEQLTPDPGGNGAYQQPPNSRIVVTANRRGTEVWWPAARNPGAATGLTLFTLLWAAAIAFQVYLDVPVVFPILFGIFGVLLVIGMLDLWLGVSRITVDAGSISLATGYLLPTRERRFAGSEIADVAAMIGMKSGSTAYYDVVIIRKDGKKIRTGRALRDKQEAEWLARIIRKGLGKET
jgi:hypothetical protein